MTAKGDVALRTDNLAEGSLTIAAGDLADVAALALTQMAGRLNADVRLDVADGRQRAAVKASAERLQAMGRSVGAANIDATVVDPTGIPLVNGTADLRAVDLSGVVIETASLRANGNATGTDLTLDAVAQGTTLRTAGRLEPREGGARLRLDRLTAARGNLNAAMTAPATFTLANGAVTIDRFALAAEWRHGHRLRHGGRNARPFGRPARAAAVAGQPRRAQRQPLRHAGGNRPHPRHGCRARPAITICASPG